MCRSSITNVAVALPAVWKQHYHLWARFPMRGSQLPGDTPPQEGPLFTDGEYLGGGTYLLLCKFKKALKQIMAALSLLRLGGVLYTLQGAASRAAE